MDKTYLSDNIHLIRFLVDRAVSNPVGLPYDVYSDLREFQDILEKDVSE